MPAGDRQRTWFPEMVEVLRAEWRAQLSWNELIALRDRLDAMLQHIRTSRHIEPANANLPCPCCGAPMTQGSPGVSVRAIILALARFGLASEAEVKALERGWKKHRQATNCDLNGKPGAAGGLAW
jgi:hypothetical protein